MAKKPSNRGKSIRRKSAPAKSAEKASTTLARHGSSRGKAKSKQAAKPAPKSASKPTKHTAKPVAGRASASSKVTTDPKAKSNRKSDPALGKKATDKKSAAMNPPPSKSPSKSTPKSAEKLAATKNKKSTGEKSAAAAAKDAAAGKNQRGRSVAEAASTVKADAQGYVYINGRRIRMISTQGRKTSSKKPRVAVSAPIVEERSEPRKSLKTWLSKKQLDHYREILLQKRVQLVGDLNALEDAALRSSGGEVSHMPIHMADVGTDTYDQDFALGMAENDRQQLREIDDALRRIADKTYGVCQLTGEPIPQARLDAKPWAKYTIEAARKMESQLGR